MKEHEEIKNLSVSAASMISAFNSSLEGPGNETLKIERIVKNILGRLEKLTSGE